MGKISKGNVMLKLIPGRRYIVTKDFLGSTLKGTSESRFTCNVPEGHSIKFINLQRYSKHDEYVFEYAKGFLHTEDLIKYVVNELSESENARVAQIASEVYMRMLETHPELSFEYIAERAEQGARYWVEHKELK